MFWIIIFVLSWSYEFVNGSPAVGVVGGVVNMNMTITDRDINTLRNLKDPNDIIILDFVTGQANPSYVASDVTYTGNISKGFVSFTLSNLRTESAGIYQYVIVKGASGTVFAGEQYLVIAESPSTPVIYELSQQAVAGMEYRLNCSAVSRSEKPGHNLTMFSEWKKNGVNIMVDTKYGVDGTMLTIRNLSRTDNNDRFTCIAFEDQRKESAESNEFPLNVYYGPDNIQITPSGELAVDEGRLLNLTCFGECNPPCSSYQWYKDSPLTLLESSQTLAITNVSRNNAGVYTCTVNNTYIAKLGTAQITVRVNYGPDRITLSPSQMLYELAENSSLSVNCSADCVPSCQYRWTGPGGNYPDKTGILSISKITRNQTGDFTCTALNPNIKSNSTTTTIKVTVQYGPDSFILSPSLMSYELAEYSFLNVNCSADCVPSCQYRWTGPGGNYPDKTGILSISKITRNQTGDFTCTALNPIITSNSARATVKVTVQYGPDTPLILIPANISYRLVEGAAIPDITCISDCVPPCHFSWTGPVMSSTGVISLGTLNRSESGSFKCRGENPRTQQHADSSEVRIIVIYGPDSPVLTPDNTVYRVNESNAPPNIQCSADCFPSCTSHWYKEQKVVYGNPADILSLGNVYRNATGTYRCQSENMESKFIAEKSIQLVVQYPPVVSIDGQNGTYNDTDIALTCSAHGVPEQYIFTLTHSSLFTGIKIRHPNFDSVSTGVISYRFSSIMDTGYYTCTVNNGIPYYRDGSVNTSVSETVCIKGPPIVTSSNTFFHAEKGQSGILAIEFYNSLLDPSVTWYRDRNQSLEKLDSSDKYNIYISNASVTLNFYSVSIQQPGFSTTLEITNVTSDDFGSYQVNVQNSVGVMSPRVLVLRPGGPPDVPHDVHIVPGSITTSSVGVEWLSGFYGGFDQTFAIEYREHTDTSWTKYSDEIFGGMTQDKYFNITVGGLHQETMYLFRMYAWNSYNRSEYSVIIHAATTADLAVEGTHKNPGISVVGIAGGVSAGFVVILVMGIGIFLWRRSQHKKQNEYENDVIREHEERQDTASGQEYEGLHLTGVEASPYLQLKDIRLEENRNANIRSPETDSNEKLHTYANSNIQMYSSLKILKVSKDSERMYENTQIK